LDTHLRRLLNFNCEGAVLAATVDEASGAAGLLIVSGGNEIRIGAHRGMAKLAKDVATAGYPVFRFDRRGIGESEGANSGFPSSGPDIAAAIEAFRAACPQMRHIVAFGNCDAASALALHAVAGAEALILANPWVIEPQDELPPVAAIRARYLERIVDPKAWFGLLTGATSMKKLASGLMRIAKPEVPSPLANQVAQGMQSFNGPISILLASRDGTAQAFVSEFRSPVFAVVRSRPNCIVQTIDSASHSFANDADYHFLLTNVLEALSTV
jgi:exosortase A-associated hydrolase 1